MVWQDYQNLVLTASLVFGKGDDSSGVSAPRTAAEAQAQIDRLLGKK